MNGVEFLEPEAMYFIMAWGFPVYILFSVFLSKSMCISTLGPSSSPSSSLVILFIHSAFSLCFFGCHIFVQNRLVVGMFSCHSLQLLIEFSFVVLEIFFVSPVLSGLFSQVVL